MARSFKLPDLGEGIHEAEIQEVLVSAGDEIEEGDNILVAETDKASVEIPSPYTGTVQAIEVEAGDLVRVGDVVMTFDGGEAEPETGEAPPGHEPQEEEGAPGRTAEAVEAEGGKESAPERREGPVPASPATRRLARELRAGRPRWFTRQICCLGQRLAHFVIAAGQKLDQMTLPPAEPAKAQ